MSSSSPSLGLIRRPLYAANSSSVMSVSSLGAREKLRPARFFELMYLDCEIKCIALVSDKSSGDPDNRSSVSTTRTRTRTRTTHAQHTHYLSRTRITYQSTYYITYVIRGLKNRTSPIKQITYAATPTSHNHTPHIICISHLIYHIAHMLHHILHYYILRIIYHMSHSSQHT